MKGDIQIGFYDDEFTEDEYNMYIDKIKGSYLYNEFISIEEFISYSDIYLPEHNFYFHLNFEIVLKKSKDNDNIFLDISVYKERNIGGLLMSEVFIDITNTIKEINLFKDTLYNISKLTTSNVVADYYNKKKLENRKNIITLFK